MKRFTGIVVRTKNAKTAHVEVKSDWMHPKYLKKRVMSHVFACHDTVGAHVGDEVEIIECRPFSATKYFMIDKVVKAVPVAEEVKLADEAAKEVVKPTKAKVAKKAVKEA